MTNVTLQHQINRLNDYALNGGANLNTPTTYFSQRDNYTMSNRTCNSSANAMYLDWLKAATGGNRLTGDDIYLRLVLSKGDTIYHENQTWALKQNGYSTIWNECNNQREDRDILRSLVCSGIPAVVNILHRGRLEAPRGGHIILLCGWLSDSKEWLAQDPYGTLQSDYQDSNGRLSRITGTQFNGRWQGGFRTLA